MGEKIMRLELKSVGELCSQQFKPLRMFMAPWVHDNTFTLLVGPRGSGKTWLGMAIAQAIASGSRLGDWPTINKTKVLYLEGEMPERVLSDRFRQIDQSGENHIVGGDISVVSCDHYEDIALPNISDPKNHEHYRAMFERYEVIIIDNLLNIARPMDSRDHELATWQRTASFLKSQRTKGKAIILLHHTGKSGLQMGTIVKENDVDTFLMVTPEIGRTERGFGAEVRFDKARYLEFPYNKPIWIEYAPNEEQGRYVWTIHPLQEHKAFKMREMKFKGMSERDIAEIMGIPLFSVKMILRGE